MIWLDIYTRSRICFQVARPGPVEFSTVNDVFAEGLEVVPEADVRDPVTPGLESKRPNWLRSRRVSSKRWRNLPKLALTVIDANQFLNIAISTKLFKCVLSTLSVFDVNSERSFLKKTLF